MYKFLFALFTMLFAMLFVPESTLADESPPLGVEISDYSDVIHSDFLAGKSTELIVTYRQERAVTYSERLHDMNYIATVSARDFIYTLAADSKASRIGGTELNNTISVRTIFNSSGGMPK